MGFCHQRLLLSRLSSNPLNLRPLWNNCFWAAFKVLCTGTPLYLGRYLVALCSSPYLGIKWPPHPMIMNSDLANTQIRELCNHKYLIFSIDKFLIKPTLSLRKFTMKEKSKEFPWLPNQNDQSVKMHRCHPRWMRPLGSGQIWRQSTIWGGGCHTGETEQGIPWWALLPYPSMKCTLLAEEGYMQLWSAFAFGLVIRDLICKGVPEMYSRIIQLRW